MTHDAINPEHYKGALPYNLETVDIIEAWAPSWPAEIRWHLGTAVKYLSRCGRKGATAEDLSKARWYLDRAIGLQSAAEIMAMPLIDEPRLDRVSPNGVERWIHPDPPAAPRSWDLPPAGDMTPPAPVRTPPAWVLPVVSRPGHYAHAEGRTVGPKDSAGAALELLASALGWGAGERHAYQEFEVPAHA